jgi:hypothetical protein
MSLVKCRFCSNRFNKSEGSCPHCGTPLKPVNLDEKPYFSPRGLGVVLLLFLGLFLLASRNGSDGLQETTEASAVSAPQTRGDESDASNWDGTRPPLDWPKFSVVPGQPPLSKRTSEEKLALAQAVENRWNEFKSGRSKRAVTMRESSEAIRSITTISSSAPQFPKAWALFVRLRKIDREVAEHQCPDPRKTCIP